MVVSGTLRPYPTLCNAFEAEIIHALAAWTEIQLARSIYGLKSGPSCIGTKIRLTRSLLIRPGHIGNCIAAFEDVGSDNYTIFKRLTIQQIFLPYRAGDGPATATKG